MTPPLRFAPVLLRLIAALALASAARAQERVWVLNSDRSVEKYRTTEDAFREAWDAPVVSIDLGRLSLDQAEVDRRVAGGAPSAVYCIGSKACLVADQLLGETPAVLSTAINWERLPARTNRLVIANEVPVASQAALYRYVFPQIRKIGILCSRRYNEGWARAAAEAGRDSGIEIVVRFIEKASDNKAALRELLPQVDALWLAADPATLASADTIREVFAQARAARKPVFSYSATFAALGAALVVAPDDATIGRQAARLLRSGPPDGTPAGAPQIPAGTEITLHLRTTQECGLELNEQALDSINHILH